jgi:hypothetical protein
MPGEECAETEKSRAFNWRPATVARLASETSFQRNGKHHQGKEIPLRRHEHATLATSATTYSQPLATRAAYLRERWPRQQTFDQVHQNARSTPDLEIPQIHLAPFH